jgi:hypothetical protein
VVAIAVTVTIPVVTIPVVAIPIPVAAPGVVAVPAAVIVVAAASVVGAVGEGRNGRRSRHRDSERECCRGRCERAQPAARRDEYVSSPWCSHD